MLVRVAHNDAHHTGTGLLPRRPQTAPPVSTTLTAAK